MKCDLSAPFLFKLTKCRGNAAGGQVPIHWSKELFLASDKMQRLPSESCFLICFPELSTKRK